MNPSAVSQVIQSPAGDHFGVAFGTPSARSSRRSSVPTRTLTSRHLLSFHSDSAIHCESGDQRRRSLERDVRDRQQGRRFPAGNGGIPHAQWPDRIPAGADKRYPLPVGREAGSVEHDRGVILVEVALRDDRLVIQPTGASRTQISS